MENDFRKKEINTRKKMKEINAGITKKQILETTGKTFKSSIIRNGNFLCGSFPPYEGVKAKKSGHFEGSIYSFTVNGGSPPW